MLVLSRKLGQRIFIGDDIVIQVVDLRPGDRVRLGIEAPDGVIVDREEIAPPDHPAKRRTVRPNK